MENLVKKYAKKLVDAGLGAPFGPGSPLVGGLDRDLVWNTTAPEIPVLEKMFLHLNINSLVFLRPGFPYDLIIGFLAGRALKGGGSVVPRDCETRTFLHDLPVVDRFELQAVVQALKQRKTVIVQGNEPNTKFLGPAVIAPGTVSPEQGFVHISSVCFACFVAFFSDYLAGLKSGRHDPEMDRVFDRVLPFLQNQLPASFDDLMHGPFSREQEVYAAMVQAGRKIVDLGLVDSYFGNLSCCRHNTLYISQTGASLDELAGCIDPVPLDGSSTAGITASSELTAHLETVARTGCQVILHGHPKFCVIASMDCDPVRKAACAFADRCHTHCPLPRHIGSVPIVPGEVGTGPFGLCNTLPRAFAASDSVIVHGHGLFVTGKTDFIRAFSTLAAVETSCKNRYLEQVRHLRSA
ncbi:MAG TPA: class II aldolase/adducin family protein [Desulfotignum sp.]|nr:class II aldolase/adducin family protein [Desulfotignum sp.]